MRPYADCVLMRNVAAILNPKNARPGTLPAPGEETCSRFHFFLRQDFLMTHQAGLLP